MAKRRRRRRRVPKPVFGEGRTQMSPAEDMARLESMIERVVGVTDEVADARMEGFVIISFWTGGRIPQGALAGHTLVAPGLDPVAIQPYVLRQVEVLGREGPWGERPEGLGG